MRAHLPPTSSTDPRRPQAGRVNQESNDQPPPDIRVAISLLTVACQHEGVATKRTIGETLVRGTNVTGVDSLDGTVPLEEVG
jgi:hypothetical protein